MEAVPIVRSRGSIRIVPSTPNGAETSTTPVSENPAWLDTSTNPPAPPDCPPLAAIVPSIVVELLDRTITRPPSPFAVAFALILAPVWIAVFAAVRVAAIPDPPLVRSRVVPIATTPPPDLPDALITAVDAMVTLLSDTTSISPPFVPNARPGAARRPPTTTEPPTPFSATIPVRSLIVAARIVPSARIRFCTIPSAALAVSCTVPPSAIITPVFVTSAVAALPSGPTGTCVTWLVTSSDSSPSP